MKGICSGRLEFEDDSTDGGLDELAFHFHRLGVRDVLVVVGSAEVDYFSGVAQTNGSEQFDFAGFRVRGPLRPSRRRRGLRPWLRAWTLVM